MKSKLIISNEEFQKIIDLLINDKQYDRGGIKYKYTRFRDAMVLFLCFSLGLRPKEATNIKIEDIDFQKSNLYIRAINNKQRQDDVIPLPYFIFNRIMEYKKLRDKIYKNSLWLFPNMNGITPIDRCTISSRFREIIKKAGMYKVSYIDKQGLKRSAITLYSLRHSFGTLVYSKTHDLVKTGVLLRHRDKQYRTVYTYLHTAQNLTKEDILDEVYDL